MKIKGKTIVNADAAKIWKLLNDPTILARITPGVSKLERIEGDKFTAISEVKIGPVKGKFEGEMELMDKEVEKGMKVVLDQKSKIGNTVATISMEMKPTEDGKTEIIYSGEAKMSGMLARMGQRIMGGVISTLSKQFFSELEKEIGN